MPMTQLGNCRTLQFFIELAEGLYSLGVNTKILKNFLILSKNMKFKSRKLVRILKILVSLCKLKLKYWVLKMNTYPIYNKNYLIIRLKLYSQCCVILQKNNKFPKLSPKQEHIYFGSWNSRWIKYNTLSVSGSSDGLLKK